MGIVKEFQALYCLCLDVGSRCVRFNNQKGQKFQDCAKISDRLKLLQNDTELAMIHQLLQLRAITSYSSLKYSDTFDLLCDGDGGGEEKAISRACHA